MNGYYSVDELNDTDPHVLELPRDFSVRTKERYILHDEFFGLWIIIEKGSLTFRNGFLESNQMYPYIAIQGDQGGVSQDFYLNRNRKPLNTLLDFLDYMSDQISGCVAQYADENSFGVDSIEFGVEASDVLYQKLQSGILSIQEY